MPATAITAHDRESTTGSNTRTKTAAQLTNWNGRTFSDEVSSQITWSAASISGLSVSCDSM
jgi:hypothetical protein